MEDPNPLEEEDDYDKAVREAKDGRLGEGEKCEETLEREELEREKREMVLPLSSGGASMECFVEEGTCVLKTWGEKSLPWYPLCVLRVRAACCVLRAVCVCACCVCAIYVWCVLCVVRCLVLVCAPCVLLRLTKSPHYSPSHPQVLR